MVKNKRPNNDDGNNPNKRPLLIHLINFVDNNPPKKDDDSNDGSDDDNCSCDSNSDQNDNNDEPIIINSNVCRNPKCDHKSFTQREIELGMNNVDIHLDCMDKNIDSIDDLIELGYYYHCKKRTTYKDIDLEKLFNLVFKKKDEKETFY